MSKTKKLLKQKRLAHIKKKRPVEQLIEERQNIQPNLDDYFKINHQLKPPYNVIIDTNFINFSIRKKLDLQREFIKCLYANVNMFITDCVIAELEKLGPVYRLALQIVKNNELIQKLTCDHKGTYADDCIVNRVQAHRCYLVATCDTELKQRIRKIPGVPIVYVKGKGYDVEKLPRAVIKRL